MQVPSMCSVISRSPVDVAASTSSRVEPFRRSVHHVVIYLAALDDIIASKQSSRR
jgi:hypothetical protein